MNSNKRQLIIAGNWKMNKVPEESEKLLKDIISGVNNPPCKIIVCVPFIDINTAVKVTEKTIINVGAQNCHFEQFGAYTGEISAEMLKSIKVDYVILGHSERRMYFYENDQIINKKVKASISSGLKVILCVGETLEEREHKITEEVVSMQIKNAFYGITENEAENVIIAYEPVWAIGTGKTATKEEADYVCGTIRKVIENLYGRSEAEKICILYGGSMNSKNARALLSMPNIDGGLIGGASLKSEDFLNIIDAASDLK